MKHTVAIEAAQGVHISQRSFDIALAGAVIAHDGVRFPAFSGQCREPNPNWCYKCNAPIISLNFYTCYGHPVEPTTLDVEAIGESFEATFETRLLDYWTVVIPPALDSCGYPVTRWHDDAMTLHRGCFYREQDAHAWAEAHLDGHPYSLFFSEF